MPDDNLQLEPAKRPKFGGRKPGSPTKRTKEARDIAAKLGFNVIEIFAHVVQRGSIPTIDARGNKTETPVSTSERIDVLKAAAGYLVPKLSATQVTGQQEVIVNNQLPTDAILKNPKMTEGLVDLALLIATTSKEDEIKAQLM